MQGEWIIVKEEECEGFDCEACGEDFKPKQPVVTWKEDGMDDEGRMFCVKCAMSENEKDLEVVLENKDILEKLWAKHRPVKKKGKKPV